MSTIGARHRAAVRPSTPLTELARTATSQIGVVGRRSAAVAATSGVAITLIGAMPAGATTGDAVNVAGVDTTTVTEAARASLESAPVVSSPQSAAWTADVVAVSAAKPVAKAPARAAAASRSATRATTVAKAVTNNPVPQSVAGNAVLEVAARYIGVRYVSGGSSPSTGFDCSGFVSYVYAQLGVSLPHSSSAYPSLGTRVSAADALPGDIIWTRGHVAIYAGGNMEIDASSPGKSVQFHTIWQSNPTFIRIG